MIVVKWIQDMTIFYSAAHLRLEKEELELPPSLSLPLSSVARTSVSARQRSAVFSEERLSHTMKETGSRVWAYLGVDSKEAAVMN